MFREWEPFGRAVDCMGGLLQLFNFNKGGMAKKILTDKKHVGGKYFHFS